jgi:methylthioribulose-1-phosphate dehydratase
MATAELTVTERQFEHAARELVQASHWIHSRGWAPATSSNFSCRLDAERCAITVSGKDKGRLSETDIMRVDMAGRPLDAAQPSAETLLHTQLYRREPGIGAILHTHSTHAVLVSMHTQEDCLIVSGLELLKALAGINSHEASLRIPIFDNTQHIAALATAVDEAMQRDGTGHAYLIRGHGLYTWGADMNEARRHLETIEFLLEYTWRSAQRA